MKITSKTWKAAATEYRFLYRCAIDGNRHLTDERNEARRWARKYRHYYLLLTKIADERRVQIEQLEADNARLREHLEAIRDYVASPTSATVNAGDMSIHERMGGIWAQAVAALNDCPAFHPDGTVK